MTVFRIETLDRSPVANTERLSGKQTACVRRRTDCPARAV